MHMVATLNMIMQFKIRQRASYNYMPGKHFHGASYTVSPDGRKVFDAPLFMVARNFLYQWNKLMQLYGVKTMISSGPTMFAFT